MVLLSGLISVMVFKGTTKDSKQSYLFSSSNGTVPRIPSLEARQRKHGNQTEFSRLPLRLHLGDLVMGTEINPSGRIVNLPSPLPTKNDTSNIQQLIADP